MQGDPCCVTTQNGLKGGIDPALTGTDVISTGTGDDGAGGSGGDNDQVNLGEGDDSAFRGGADGNGDAYDGGPGIDRIELFNRTNPTSETTWTPDDFSIDLTPGRDRGRTTVAARSRRSLRGRVHVYRKRHSVGHRGVHLIGTPGTGGGQLDASTRAAGSTASPSAAHRRPTRTS